MKIATDQPYRDYLPELAPYEFEALAADIEANGIHTPVVVDEHGVVLDGFHRLKIKPDAPVRVVSGLTELEKQAFVYRSNLSRRNLSPDQRWETLGRMKAIAASLRESDPKKWTQAAVAALLGVDRTTVGWWASNANTHNACVVEKPDGRYKLYQAVRETVAERVRAGETQSKVADDYKVTRQAIALIVKQVERQQQVRQQKEAILAEKLAQPDGLYDVLVVDPPWSYGREYDPEGSRVANPYPEMTQEQLLEITMPAAEDAVLFLWTTHQFIWDAKVLLDHWGFTNKALLVWDKGKMGMGHWLRMQCEFCLVGIKGDPYWENTIWRDIIHEDRREHSRKPEIFYKMVEEITIGRRLDYYSRSQREGWECFGNDTEHF